MGTKIRNFERIRKTPSQNRQGAFDEIGEWAVKKFNLHKIPHRNTILKIRRDKDYIQKSVQEGNLKKKRQLRVTNLSLDKAITTWILDMFEREVFVSDELIQEKARRMQILLNQEIQAEKQIHLKFSNVWLQKLKNRNHFKFYRSHGESGNVDQTVINKELPGL